MQIKFKPQPKTQAKKMTLEAGGYNFDNLQISKKENTVKIAGISYIYRRYSVMNEQKEELFSAKLIINDNPLKFCFVQEIETNQDYRKLGIAEFAMKQINHLLINKNLTGVLIDGSRINNLYKKYNWSQYKDTTYWTFNVASEEHLKDIIAMCDSYSV
jgi:hypothetical protein